MALVATCLSLKLCSMNWRNKRTGLSGTVWNCLFCIVSTEDGQPHAHTHTHTHMHTHARTHTHMNTLQTHAQTRTHTHAHTRTHTRTHAHTQAHTHTHAHTDTHAHSHACPTHGQNIHGNWLEICGISYPLMRRESREFPWGQSTLWWCDKGRVPPPRTGRAHRMPPSGLLLLGHRARSCIEHYFLLLISFRSPRSARLPACVWYIVKTESRTCAWKQKQFIQKALLLQSFFVGQTSRQMSIAKGSNTHASVILSWPF